MFDNLHSDSNSCGCLCARVLAPPAQAVPTSAHNAIAAQAVAPAPASALAADDDFDAFLNS